MKSASNECVLKGSLQVLHAHVLLVSPLGAGPMAQPGTDQHEGGVAVQETAHHMGTAADLPVAPFNDIVGTDVGPMFTEKIAVSQRFLNAILRLAILFLLPHRASVISSMRRTDTPARYVSMWATSTLLSRRQYHTMIAVSKEPPLSLYLEGNVLGSGGKVAAAIPLTLLIALVPAPGSVFLPRPPATR